MTFNEFIKALTHEQVNTWWNTIAPTEAPDKVEEENWKYKLSKNGKTLPFKYTVSQLAISYNLDFKSKDFSSNVTNRDAFCDAFDFDIIEDLVYDTTEIKTFNEFYTKRVVNKNLFQSFATYTNHLINSCNISPYKIRMALTGDGKKATIILGMRAVLQYTENEGNVVIGLILNNDFVSTINKNEYDGVYPFKGVGSSKSFVTFYVKQWDDLQKKILDNNLISFREQYLSIKDTKRVSWNTEANTTNSVLKYLLFKNENVSEWVNKNNTKVYNMDFFNESEFQLISETQGKKYNKNNPVDREAYDRLFRAYVKLEYWGNEIKKQLFPDGVFKINKRPTNQGNHFDGYLWSKLYPSYDDFLHNSWIAITLGLDSTFHYSIKIDTVGLIDSHPKRQNYLKRRGDYFNSSLVKLEDYKTISNWDELINVTVENIKELLEDYQTFKEVVTLNDKGAKTISSPLNQILYGPPGTGKTYNTVLEAAKIITGNEAIGYAEALKVFNDNLGQQIEFITFHQNYSYEDFIQGLRPDTENGSALTFEKKDGVFKRIADRAMKNLEASQNPASAKKDFDLVFSELIQPLNEGDVTEIEIKMKKSSFFITAVGEKSIDFRKSIGDSEHTLSINTLRKMYDKGVNDIILGGLQPYYNPILELLLEKGKSTVTAVARQNYVIIIDEINRANISRVFGELITLIEEDKRSHGAIPMRVTLPSGDPFIVPSNLYIIGTMNTADKSIALLDIALRRRFEFVPKYPNVALVKEEYKLLFEKMNAAIKEKKNHDFTVGHAYFMEDRMTLNQIINHKVIPLLLEYFMNSEEQVIEIMAQAGVVVGGWPLQMKGIND